MPPPRPAAEHGTPPAELRTPYGDVFRRQSNEQRLTRFLRQIEATRTRETETDPAHLLEATAVLVYDPDIARLREDLPPQGHGRRFDEFLDTLAATYRRRFDATPP